MTEREALLLAYVDGELEANQVEAVERLLDNDPEAREQVANHRAVAAMLRSACADEFYCDKPAERVVSLHEVRTGRLRRTLLAAAASLLVGVVGFGAGYELGESPPSHFEALLNDIAEYHAVYTRDPSHLVELPASERAEIQQWLGRSIGEKITIPDLSAAGFEFAGGRLLVGDGRPVAQLLYTRPGALPLGICVTARRDAPQRLEVKHRDQLTLAGWPEGDSTYVIVGDLGDDQTRALVRRVSSSVRDGTRG